MRSDDRAVAVFALDADHALPAAAVAREVLELAALAVAVLRRDEERLRIVHRVQGDDAVAFEKPYAADARRRAPHAPHVGRGEAHRAPVLREHYDVFARLHEPYVDKLVAFLDVDGAYAALVDVLVVAEQRLLDGAELGREEDVDVAFERAYRQKLQDLLAFLEIEKVDERTPEARARRLRDLVRILEEEAPRVREEHERVVRLRDEDESYEILLLHLRALYAVAAALLLAVLGERHALHIAAVRERDDARRVGNQVLHRDLVLVRDDLGAALRVRLRAVLRLELRKVLADDRVDLLGVRENRLVLCDRGEQLRELVGKLVALEPDELVEAHLEDRVDLQVGEAEALEKARLRLVSRLRRADDRDDFVEVVDREEEAVYDVLPRLRLPELEARTPRDDLEAVVGVAAAVVLEVQDLRPAAVDREHDRAERRLELRVLVEVVEHDLAHRVALYVDDDPDVLLRLVAYVAYALYHLVLDEVGHVLDHLGLVDRVGDLGDDDALAAVLLDLDLGLAADSQLPAPELVHRRDSVVAADLRARREVGPLDELHEVVDRARLSVPDVVVDSVAELVQVVRRYVRRHADGDAARAVEKEVRQLRRQDRRLLERLVEVRHHVDRVLLEVGEKLVRHALHPDFGVSHRRRAVAVYRAEVAVTVDERNPEREVLRHADDRVVDRGVAVRMVLADHLADDARRLHVLDACGRPEFVHREEAATVDWLHSVASVRKCAPDDYAH